MKKFLISIFIFCIFFSTSLAFSDDSNFSWAKGAVDKWSSKGYFSGYPDGTFRGNKFITRAEVIAVINKLNNSGLTTEKRVAKDIKNSDWFFNDMGNAFNCGLISLDEDGNLRPNEFATREEVIIILSKLLNISYSGNLDNAKVKKFLDCDKINSAEYKRVAGVVEEGLVNGYSDNTLRPKNNITRAEFACIINNAISDVFSSGEYDNRVFSGNIIINGQNVKMTNSEVKGKVFVLDGARNGLPSLINTNVSEGINSRVGEILIKNIAELETVTEHEFNNTENTQELAFAKLTYSETDWTNEDVIVTVKMNNDDYKILNGDNDLIFKRNGEKEIEYEYNGNIIKVKAKVDNIDKIVPKVTATVQNGTKEAVITVNIEEDGLSPIVKISCSNGISNKLDEETGNIEKTITVTDNGSYTITVEDEAGNEGKVKVKVDGIE